MAAILKLRRGTSTQLSGITLVESELFFNTTNKTIVVGDGSSTHTLVKIGTNTGSVEFSGDITASNAKFTGEVLIEGNITLGGTLITIGDGNTDNIVISGELSSSIIPNDDNSFDIGSPLRRYRHIHAVSASIDELLVGGSGILSSSITNFVNYSSSIDSRIESLNLYTQSNDQRVDSIESFTQSIDLRVDALESSQSYFDNTYSSSIDSRINSLNSYTESNDQRVDSIEIFTQSIDLRVVDLESTGSNHESRLDVIETTFSSSVDLRLDNLEWTGSNQESRLDVIETTFSSSVNSRLDSLEFFSSSEYQLDSSSFDSRVIDLELSQSYFDNTFSGSVDSRLVDAEWTGSNHEGRITSIEGYSASLDSRLDDLEATGSDHEARLDTIEGPFSSSLDSRLNTLNLYTQSNDLRVDDLEATGSDHENRLDVIEGPLSSSINQQLDSIHSYTSSLKNSIDVNGSNLTVLGNLTVQGTQTSLNTTEVLVEDILLALASGSTTSVEADGGGIYISGADASMTWNHADQLIEFNTKVSSSVGFKGDGSELTDIQYGNIIFNGSGIVSGSSQINLTQTTNYVSGIKTRLNAEGVFSSSIQVNADTVTNFDSNVKDKLNLDDIHSGSYLGTATTSNLDEGTNLYYTNQRVQDVINSNGIISSSLQLDGVFLEINGDGVVSGSSQINVNETQNFQSFSSSVDLRLDNVESSNESDDTRLTALETFSSSLDLKYLNTYGDDVVSGSSQIDLTQTTNYVSGIKDRLNLETVISGSDQVTSSFDSRYLQINGDDVISGSDQVTQSLDLRYEPIASSTNTLVSSSLYSTNEQGSFTASINGVETNINLGLRVGDTPTFENINLPSLSQLSIGTEFSVLLYSSSGEIAYSELGTAAYYHVSSSIANGDPNTLGNASAVKNYIDDQLLIIGAGDITSVNAGDGMSGGALSGSATLTLDTGSTHFIDGVNGVVQLGDGILSSSAQISAYGLFAELDGDGLISSSTQISNYGIFAELNGDGLVSSSLQITNGSGILSSSVQNFDTFSGSVDSRLDILEGESYENPLTFNDTSTIDLIRTGDVITANAIGGIVSSSAQISNYGVFAELNGDGLVSSSQQISFNGIIDKPTLVSGSSQISFSGITGKPTLVSGSSQIDIEQTTNFTTFSSSLDSRLDNQELFSSSINTTIKTKMNLDGVISGSSQVLAGSGIVSSSQQISNYGVFAELNGDNLVSSSTQISAYNTFLEINGDSVVSSSAQISAYNTFLEINGDGVVSGSDQLTGSLVDLSSDQTINGTKTFNDIVVNGTGSFAYITSINGTAKIIGDSFIVVNTDTPTSRYAGLSVYDSGSTLSTASFYFDGQTNDWGYEYSSSAGVDYAVTIFGPEYSTKGNPTYLTSNTIPKAVDNHHLNDSNISDSGTLITLGSNVQVNGNIAITGTVDGIDLQNFSSSVDGRLDTLEGTSNENPLTFNDTTTIDFNRVGDTITANVIGGIVSGSSQITLTGDVTGTANANTVGKIQGISITSGEATQLANINTTTISTTQWGYLGELNQGLTQTSTVQFGKVGVGGASDATYELKVTGDVGATGDVVAYVSSDRRLKDEITPIQNPLQKINSIGGYSFVWNENQHIYKGKDYGVIAQEIENILPELVETRENGYKAVKYDRIVSLLIEGIKELSKEVSELKEKIGK